MQEAPRCDTSQPGGFLSAGGINFICSVSSRATTEAASLTLSARSANQVPRSSGATVATSDLATGSSVAEPPDERPMLSFLFTGRVFEVTTALRSRMRSLTYVCFTDKSFGLTSEQENTTRVSLHHASFVSLLLRACSSSRMIDLIDISSWNFRLPTSSRSVRTRDCALPERELASAMDPHNCES